MPDLTPSASTPAEPATQRTTIDSLAPELIGRILELAVEDDTSIKLYQRRNLLRTSSLVCGRWRAEGQRLLTRSLVLLGNECSPAWLSKVMDRIPLGFECDQVAVNMLGLPYLLQLVSKVATVRAVVLLDDESLALVRKRGSDYKYFECFLLKFLSEPSSSSVFGGAVRVEIGAGWWTHSAFAGWVSRFLTTSAPTIRHLSLAVTALANDLAEMRASTDRLKNTILGLNLTLSSLEISRASTADASHLFRAYPAAVTSLVVHRVPDDLTSTVFAALNAAPRELQLVVNGSLLGLRDGSFLRAFMDTAAAARLQRLTIEGWYAKTLILLSAWKEFARQASAAGIMVTLLERDGVNWGRGQVVARV